MERNWIGETPKDGTPGENILKQEISKLINKEGMFAAWDDVAGVQLDPVEVLKARKTELKICPQNESLHKGPEI